MCLGSNFYELIIYCVLKSRLDTAAVIVEAVILAHIVAGEAVALNHNGACGGNCHIPAYISDAGLNEGGFEAHLYCLFEVGYLEADERHTAYRMLGVVGDGLVAECGMSNLALGREEGIHTAAGDIVHVILAAADSDERIDEVGVALVAENSRNSYSVDGAAAETVHFLVLSNSFFGEEHFSLHKLVVNFLGISLAEGHLLNSQTTEGHRLLCKESILALCEFAEFLKTFLQIHKISAHKFTESAAESKLVLKNFVSLFLIKSSGHLDVVVHSHKGETLFLSYKGIAEGHIIKISHSVAEHGIHHIEEENYAISARLLVDKIEISEKALEAAGGNSAQKGLNFVHIHTLAV